MYFFFKKKFHFKYSIQQTQLTEIRIKEKQFQGAELFGSIIIF